MIRVLICLCCLGLWFGSVATATSSLAPPTNVRITADPELQNEEQVWMCDTDSNVIVANWRDFRLGYRQIGVGRSIDGGQTWTHALIPPSQQFFGVLARQSDPTMTGDQYGNFIMSAMDYDGVSGNGSTISVYRSLDKGATWLGPVPAMGPTTTFAEDKQFTTIDRTGGSYDGNFYMVWARYPNPIRIMFVRSTDGGATFDTPVEIGSPQTSTGCGASVIDAGQFSNVVVHPSGNVHAFWIATALDSGGTCTGIEAIKHVVSIDGGVSFTSPDTILSVSGQSFIDGGITVYSQPACDADLTGGPFAGNLYMALANSGPEDIPDVWDVDFIRSTDNGSSWSGRITINDDALPLVDNFHPWLIVNEEGVIIIVFYDQRLDPGHTLFDIFAAYSFDGGETFTTNHRLSSVSSSPDNLKIGYDSGVFPTLLKPELPESAPTYRDPQAGLIGEYIGVTANYDKINAVWTDSRDGNSEVYTANWYLPKLEPRLSAPDSGSLVSSSPSFAWATSWKHDVDRYRLEISHDPDFNTITESRVIDTNLYTIDVALPDAIYYWRVKTFDAAESDSSQYSAVWQFEVNEMPPAPLALLSPYDGEAVPRPLDPFDWTTAIKTRSIVTYAFYITPDASLPNQFVMKASGLTDSQYDMTDSLMGSEGFRWYVVATDEFLQASVSDTGTFDLSCCEGTTGDVNVDGLLNLTDLTQLVNQLFVTFEPVDCVPEANTSGDPSCELTLTDLTVLVQHLFVTFDPLADCNDFDNTLCQ